MRIEIKDNIKDKNIIQKYKNILHNLDKKIVKLIENQDYTMLLTHCIQDIQDIENGETIQKNYVENMQEYPYRGILSNENKDNRLYIAIFEKYLKSST